MGQDAPPVTAAPREADGRIGIGLRQPHHEAWLALRPPVDFLEIHPENYRDTGSAQYTDLETLRQDYAVSLHGVSLGLGNATLDAKPLACLCELNRRLEPLFVSEHVCWTAFRGHHFHHLLPMPFTRETHDRLTAHIQEVQDALRRPILIEPIAAYMRHREDDRDEVDLINGLAAATGCGILLDLTNLYVNARNHGEEAEDFLARIDAAAVHEVHLAGCRLNRFPDGHMWIDSHDTVVPDGVWSLYDTLCARMGPRATLLERDASLPALPELVDEIGRAQRRMQARTADVTG
ncbi:MAG: DUF692 domain-containing protein [Gammaproteobacteria bacterium]|nr:DUF692 domain-containing protein [Gammaproteobacteria bacterium]